MAYPENTINDTGLKKVWDMIIAKLNLKVDKEAGKGLSTNDYTTTEKNKLAGIESGAEVNTVTSVAGKTGDVTLDKSDVGLSNVGNFKAVSTSANQGLTDTEKSNARANIDTPSNGDIQSSKTVSGNPITVTNAYPMNAEDITVDITPQQDLHGYDHPWAGGAGKNKLPMTNRTDIMTFVTDNATGSVHMTGTAQTSGWANGIYISMSNFPAGNYIVSCAQNPNHMNVLVNWEFWEISPNGTPITVTQGDAVRFAWMVTAGQTYDCSVSGLMLRLATETDATFAPYSNECPIEGWTSETVDRVGKNWFTTDENDYESGTIDPSTGALLIDSSYKRTKEYLPIRAGSYKLVNAYNFRIFLYDSSKNYLGYVDGASVMTISKLNTGFYKARWSAAGNDMSTAMLYLSSFTDSTYEPYQGISRTVNFGQTVYGGKWHSKGGVDKTHANIASYNGETINEPWLSSLDEYVAGATPTTGAQVVYPLTTPTTINTDAVDIPMLQGINTISGSTGDVTLKYQPDNVVGELKGEIRAVEAELAEAEEALEIVYEDHVANTSMGIIVDDGYSVGDMPFSNALDISKTGYIPIAVTDTSVVSSTVADQGEIATHCILDATNNRVRFYVHVMDSAASLTIPPNSLTFRVAYKKA